MVEEKDGNIEGQASKKPSRGRKTSALSSLKKSTQSVPKTEFVATLTGKIDCMAEEVQNNPMKSFDKKDRCVLIQSYEKLIASLVREINCSRQ